MARNSGIPWCTATWNPWIGCHKVSPACDHCYAETWARRAGRDFATVTRAADRTFVAPHKWQNPELVFTCSLSDFFHPAADEWRPAAWEIMRTTHHHHYLVLTKRSQKIEARLPPQWPFPNVWLGVTVEQPEFLYRLAELVEIPAAGRFVSCEPLLGEVRLTQFMGEIDWIQVGGESGPRARPLNSFDLEALILQGRAGGVPVYVKQLSELAGRGNFRDPTRWHERLRVQEWPAALVRFRRAV